MPGDTSHSPRWNALLMAGGESRRMGCDKAALVVGGEPLWRRQVRTLRAAGFEEIIVARADREWADEPGVMTAPDAAPGCGPLGGLVGGLRQAKAAWTLVLAVDLPLMPAAFLRKMIAMTELDGRGVVPVIDGRLEPLAAVYPRACLAYAEECLADHRFSMQGLVKLCVTADLMRSFEVRKCERMYFRNVNTPDDLANVERQLATAPDRPGG